MDKVSKILLAELRAGTIGRISLETPAMMEQELVELAVVREREKPGSKNGKDQIRFNYNKTRSMFIDWDSLHKADIL